MLWRMLSRLETCIVYSCIWCVTLAKSIVPRKTWRKLWHSYISKLFLTKMQVKFSIFFHHRSLNVIEIGSDRAHCECMRRFASFGTTHVIHCIITNFACLSGNKFTNWCPSARLVFKSIKVIFHCSWAVHLERNISFKESIHNCNCGFPWFNLSLLIICCLWQLPFTGARGTDHPPFSIFLFTNLFTNNIISIYTHAIWC